MLLDKNRIDAFIEVNEGWESKDAFLIRNFEFGNFSEALAFTVRLGILAEKVGHHPDIRLHSWNKVEVTLSTHSEGGITKKDVNLAEEINKQF